MICAMVRLSPMASMLLTTNSKPDILAMASKKSARVMLNLREPE